MKIIEIQDTKQSPSVYCNAEKGLLKLSGRSLPEDSEMFYSSIIDWVHEFEQSPYHKLDVQLRLDYFNTASAKNLYTLVGLVDKLKANEANDISLKWFYEKDDDTMMDLGKEFSDLYPNLVELVEDE